MRRTIRGRSPRGFVGNYDCGRFASYSRGHGYEFVHTVRCSCGKELLTTYRDMFSLSARERDQETHDFVRKHQVKTPLLCMLKTKEASSQNTASVYAQNFRCLSCGLFVP